MTVAVTVLQGLIALTATSLLIVAIGLLRRGAPARRGEPWPAVDVVVPARDEERTLPGTLASLLAQDYPGPLTVWVVDDRSTDGTARVVEEARARDPRVRLVRVGDASRRWAPKVNAVRHGIVAGRAPWIVTTDADCRHHPRWLRALLSEAVGDVVMVAGYVETARDGEARGLLGRFEALDWASLMFTARSLTRFGAKVAASANNQAYARAAWQAVGGFGVAARAPSGDEDLLVQRLGRLPGSRIVFTDHPHARVRTAPMPGWHAFLNQRRRWVSRFQHLQQYQAAYLVGVALLGVQSVALTLAIIAYPLLPQVLGGVLGAWGVLVAVQVAGMHVGLAQLERRDLMGWPVLVWALLHPFVIAIALVWSLLRPGSWRAGARSYRRRLWRASWRRRRDAWWRQRAARPGPARVGRLVAGPHGPPTEGRGDRW